MIKLETTLKQLNDLFGVFGTWQATADAIGFNRATINKWFNGKRIPTGPTREYIAYAHGRMCRRQQ